ncbi:hypothetical protein D3Z36_02545 [Lachnospiraceae bacterium]|nr:hypothetical protein [Lachnospiraceae bacterium]
MDMIKKIALTASTMLFVLTQIFSLYVIFTGHRQKIKLIESYGEKILSTSISDFSSKLFKMNYENNMQDRVVTYYFRENMPEGSALYKGKEELYNSTPYDFEVDKVKFYENSSRPVCRQEKISDTYLLVLISKQELGRIGEKSQSYVFLYVIDITYIFKESAALAFREILISVFASLTLALLLIFLIKKITRPLQAVNEAQRQLIGSMSHELKTPLTAMKGYSETLLNVKLSREQEGKALDYINRESGRLSRLTEKMMELTSLYEPECRIVTKKIAIETLFMAVEENVTYRLEEKHIKLKREGNYKGQEKELDADLATSFLINLINNSIMASEPGSHIYLGADEQSLWVRDEGCGIPPQEVDKVRKAFYRVDKSRSRKSGNMGLGLALCEQIAAVHHASMKIESQVGKGTKISWMEKGE